MTAAAFGTLVALSFAGTTQAASECTLCQQWRDECDCTPPGRRKCPNCPGTIGTCPPGFKLSYAWGYPRTGCWCTSCGTSTYKICCDCTESFNSSYTQNPGDCGCGWTLAQGGDCQQPFSEPVHEA